MTKFTEADERNIGLICIGFVPGFLFVIGISPEREILFPFFGSISFFEFIVAIATIIGLLSGIIYLIWRLKQISAGIVSFAFSFISGYLMGTAIVKEMNMIFIIIGLIALFISFGLTKPAFEPSK